MAVANISHDYDVPLKGHDRVPPAKPNPHTEGYDDDGQIITIDLRKFVRSFDEYATYLDDDARLHITLTSDGIEVADFMQEEHGFPVPALTLTWTSVSTDRSLDRCRELMQSFKDVQENPVESRGVGEFQNAVEIQNGNGKRIGIFYPLIDVGPSVK